MFSNRNYTDPLHEFCGSPIDFRSSNKSCISHRLVKANDFFTTGFKFILLAI